MCKGPNLNSKRQPLTVTRIKTESVDHARRCYSASRLPVELMLSIFDHLLKTDGKSAATFRACALASRAWHQLARRYIFHTIVIRNKEKFDSFVVRIDENRDIGPWVNQLCFIRPISWLHAGFESWESWLQDDGLPQKLPSIQVLAFQNYQFRPINLRPFQVFVSVYKLSIRKSRIREEDLTELISNLPRLTTLYLCDMRLGARSTPVELKQPSKALVSPCLQHLVYTPDAREYRQWRSGYNVSRGRWSEWSSGLLPWLQQAGCARTLRTLQLRLDENLSPSAITVGLLLDTIGDTLEELDITFPQVTFWNKYRKNIQHNPFNLSLCTGLRYVTLGSPLHPAVLDLLAAPLPSLHELTFNIEFDNPRSVQIAKFRSLDSRISSSDFPLLQNVRLNYCGALHVDTVTDRLERAFAQWSERKPLHITMNKRKA